MIVAIVMFSVLFVTLLMRSFLVPLVPVSAVIVVVSMVLTKLLRICATVMICEGIAGVPASLAIAVSTGLIAVAATCFCQTRGQRGEHDGKYKYLHFKTSIS